MNDGKKMEMINKIKENVKRMKETRIKDIKGKMKLMNKKKGK